METEVSSSAKEDSNNLNVQSIKNEFNKEITELKTSESSETSIETKISNNKSGASPKLFLEHDTTNFSNENSENKTGEDSAPGDCQYFFEDEVFRIDKKGRVKFGIVLETPGTYSGDEDDEFEEILEKDEIRVVWYPEFKESVQSENSIGLADRTLMPGDVVRRLVPGKETQRGYCRDINMKADVKVLGTRYVIKNVNAERLKLISNWQRDGAVCLDSWVGSTKDVEEKAVLRTVSGCRIEISSNDFYNFQDLNSRRQRDIFNPKVFYPGNTIIGSLPPMENIKVLTPDIPLHINKKGKPLSRKFIIESVYTDCVWVNWQCKALSDEVNLENIILQPSPCVKGEDLKRLKRLNLFESCMLQIVDRNYLTYSACDTLVKKSDWDKEQAIKFREIFRKQKEENQKIFVRTSFAGTTGTAGSHHHYEKFKKKLSLSLDDKSTNKLKRNVLKGDKSCKREAPQDLFSHEKSTPKSNKDCEAEWFSTEDETEIDEDNCVVKDIDNIVENLKQFKEDCISTTTTMSTCSSPSPHTSPKHLTKRQLKKKARTNFKKSFSSEPNAEFQPKEGDELVTEALLVYSTATVVWQDGTIEQNIPSTQLYPINHLDNHEFFPGDFVISAKEDQDLSHRDYGVIQTVDHEGRIAHVKWFTTYTSADDPTPTYRGEAECSVYDLKDQPDFQYRPGTMVIRVANFVGEDAKCTAGQVIDNYTDGRVKVWWVDGHISLCWPQDLFEVGQLDQGALSHASDDSWETESENSEVGCEGETSVKLSITESDILANIEKARVALARLQEIFNINPDLQNSEVMRKLLTVYKSCRYLDRLLNTTFFHEDHFLGLIERVRKAGAISLNERVQDQKNRLFSDDLQACSPNKHQHRQTTILSATSQDDSGNFSRNEFCDCSSTSYTSSPDLTNIETNNSLTKSNNQKPNDQSNSSTELAGESSELVCVRLCSLLKAQLVECLNEICAKYYKDDKQSLSENAKIDLCHKEDENIETRIDIENNKEKEEREKNEKIVKNITNTDEIAISLLSKHSADADAENAEVTEEYDVVPTNVKSECFQVLSNAPKNHKYHLTIFHPNNTQQYYKAVQREHRLLKTSLPPGVYVKVYEDRMDLLSVMIEGPKRTPYEDGIFFFDIQLGRDYPKSPPHCHYISYCTDRLNPNLYEDGKVCVSLLGTWMGKDTEVWGPNSTLLQVIVSIQGLILVPEPYFNEAGYEKQKGTQQGKENSRMYNEMAIIKLVQATTKIMQNPPEIFRDEVSSHIQENGMKMYERLKGWMELSKQKCSNAGKNLDNNQEQLEESAPQYNLPDFPLIPASRGFCLTLAGLLENLKQKINSLNESATKTLQKETEANRKNSLE